MKKLLLLFTIIFINRVIISQVRIEIYVVAPQLNENENVFIGGNEVSLGNWNPGLISLDKLNDSTWNKVFAFPINSSLEFKFTKGTWGKEALNQNGKIPGNTTLIVTKDTTITIRVTKWSDAQSNISGKITGQVKYHRSFEGNNILPRDIVVWLPPSYDSIPNKKYPVLYMQDGQNIFDAATSAIGIEWQVDETVDSLIKSDAIEEIIIVGIYNTELRGTEYNHTPVGYNYMKFIVSELKPFIDSTYRTLPDRNNTAIAGSSSGGLISFMMLWEYSDIFSKAACVSSAFKFDDIDYVSTVKKYAGPKKEIKIYIDNGGIGLEKELQPGIDEMLIALKEKGFEENKDMLWVKDSLAEHNESAWAKRVYKYLKFLFPNKEKD
jgi:predicted alpha/beta superfamily hydrolase